MEDCCSQLIRQLILQSGVIIKAPYYELMNDTLTVQLSNPNDPTSYILSDLIAGNINDRPIYFAITVPRDYYSDYQRNLSLEGLAYRITPFEFASANTIPNPDCCLTT